MSRRGRMTEKTPIGKKKWIVGATLHHVKFGYGVIVKVEGRHGSISRKLAKKWHCRAGRFFTADTWTIRVLSNPKHANTRRKGFSWAGDGDRNGWHLFNSKTARTCEQCRDGKSEHPSWAKSGARSPHSKSERAR
jgi:hypothetical protein